MAKVPGLSAHYVIIMLYDKSVSFKNNGGPNVKTSLHTQVEGISLTSQS